MAELTQFLSDTNIDIISINETWLTSKSKLKLPPQYSVFRCDRANSTPGGGALLAVNKNLNPHLLDIPVPYKCEGLAISIKLRYNINVTIVSLYCPPNIPLDTTFLANLELSYNHLIICGDLNAKHQSWGYCNKPNRNGQILNEFLNTKSELIMLNSLVPKEPTFFPSQHNKHHSYDVLDFFIASPQIVTNFTNLSYLDPFGNSDHIPLLLVLANLPQNQRSPSIKPRYKFNGANWKLFATDLKDRIASKHLNTKPVIYGSDYRVWTNQIDNFVLEISTCIQEAADATLEITNHDANKSRSHMKPTKESLMLIQNRRKLQRERRRLDMIGTDTSLIRNQINQLQRRIARNIAKDKRESWRKFTSKMTHRDMNQLWKKYNSIRKGMNNIPSPTDYPFLLSDPHSLKNKATSDDEKANLFATHLANVFKDQNCPHFNPDFKYAIDQTVLQHIDWFQPETLAVNKNDPQSEPTLPSFEDDEHILAQPLRINELTQALKHLKNRSPGPDNIFNIMIKKGPPSLQHSLLRLFNTCLKIGYHPTSWKEGLIKMLPKPDKNPNLPSSYRPITLLNNLGKLMERLITHRIYAYLESKSWFKSTQSGFRRNRSTNDHILRLSECTRQAFNRKNHVVAAFLDIEKAFDSIWINGLRIKLVFQALLPKRVVRWISNYLSDRNFTVDVNGYLSPKISIEAGVPQGSVISPLLYNIFINDSTTNDNYSVFLNYRHFHLMCSNFADDSAFWAESFNPHLAAASVQKAITTNDDFCSRWRIKVNGAKSQAVLFTPSGRANKPWKDPKGKKNLVRLNASGSEIPVGKSAKFLGVIFDSGLTYRTHIDEILSRCHSRLNLMKCLRGTNWGADADTLVTLYKQSIRPLLEYGSLSFITASNTQLSRLQKVQNHALRIAYKAPIYTPTDWLHKWANIPRLTTRWNQLGINYLKRVKEKKSNELMNDFIKLSLDPKTTAYKTPLSYFLNL